MMIINPYRYAGLPAIRVNDTFTDTALTALASHAPDVDVIGTGWETPYSQGWRIAASGTRAEASATWPAESHHTVIDSGASDVTIEANVNFWNNAGQISGIILRSIPDGGTPDNSTFWEVEIYMNAMRIVEWNAGTATDRASVVLSRSDQSEYAMKVVASGTTITAYFTDNVNEKTCSYSSATLNQTVTKHGMSANKAGNYFEYYKITAT